jgi:hypothetical protein
MDYSHSKGYCATENGYAVGEPGSESAVITPSGKATKVPFVWSVLVEDLDADADIADRVIMSIPSYHSIKVTAVSLIPYANAAGIDASNTSVIALKVSTDTVATRTYNNTVAFPTAGNVGSLVVDSAKATLAPGAKLLLSITNGTTANLPAFLVQIEGELNYLGV